MEGLEEMGMQVEVDGAYGDPHLNTELRRLGREPGYWGVVMHGAGTGKVVVACVLKEGQTEGVRRDRDGGEAGAQGEGTGEAGDADGTGEVGRGGPGGELQPEGWSEVLHAEGGSGAIQSTGMAWGWGELGVELG